MADKSKTIVLTGGTSGVGLEIVKLLEQSNRLSVIARPSAKLDAFRRQYEGVAIYEADLADPDAVAKVADRIVRANETIDVLINNAAVQYTPTFLDDDFRLQTIRREIDTNLTTPAVLSFLLLPSLLRSGRAVIINVNSALAFAPKTSSSIYCATKGGLDVFSRSLRYQLETANVDVKQAFLPLVDTEMTKGRGSGKISAEEAASKIIAALDSSKSDIDIGKTKILRAIMRVWPGLARKIMKNG